SGTVPDRAPRNKEVVAFHALRSAQYRRASRLPPTEFGDTPRIRWVRSGCVPDSAPGIGDEGAGEGARLAALSVGGDHAQGDQVRIAVVADHDGVHGIAGGAIEVDVAHGRGFAPAMARAERLAGRGGRLHRGRGRGHGFRREATTRLRAFAPRLHVARV